MPFCPLGDYPAPRAVLTGHDQEVVCVSVCAELGLVISGAKGQCASLFFRVTLTGQKKVTSGTPINWNNGARALDDHLISDHLQTNVYPDDRYVVASQKWTIFIDSLHKHRLITCAFWFGRGSVSGPYHHRGPFAGFGGTRTLSVPTAHLGFQRGPLYHLL